MIKRIKVRECIWEETQVRVLLEREHRKRTCNWLNSSTIVNSSLPVSPRKYTVEDTNPWVHTCRHTHRHIVEVKKCMQLVNWVVGPTKPWTSDEPMKCISKGSTTGLARRSLRCIRWQRDALTKWILYWSFIGCFSSAVCHVWIVWEEVLIGYCGGANECN